MHNEADISKNIMKKQNVQFTIKLKLDKLNIKTKKCERKMFLIVSLFNEFPLMVNSFCIDTVRVLHIHKEVCHGHAHRSMDIDILG